MHSIPRSPEPHFLPELLNRYSDWNQLEIAERRLVRGALAEDFNGICGYCERSCVEPTRAERDNEESVDHFRPRRHFPNEWLNWLNLIYSCRRCNQSKGSKWPTAGDYDNQRLARITRYQQVSEYVCPNQSEHGPQCDALFDYDLAAGEIGPANDVDDAHWSMAYRTIADIDLNSIQPSQQNLPELRKEWLRILETTLRRFSNPDERSAIVFGHCQRDQPFSSFVLAYARRNGFEV